MDKVYRSISDAWSAQWFFQHWPQHVMQFAWEIDVCNTMHVTPSETYAEVRNLGANTQGGVEWYVTGYTGLS